MVIEDVATISGRGTVANGPRADGERQRSAEIVGALLNSEPLVATGIEMFRKTMDFCEAGDNVGIPFVVLSARTSSAAGLLCKPGTVIYTRSSPVRFFYVLTKEEGGRHTPFFSGYRPQFYFRN